MATTVISAFDTLLARQRLTDNQESVAKSRVAALSDFFNNNFAMAETPFTIGSYARGTLCAGERDIDMMAPFSASDYWERFKNDSRTFLYWVRNTLNDRYATTKVSSRQVAVKLDFTTIAADVVPCFKRTGGGYVMPNGQGGWMATNPPYHTRLIADAHRAHGYRLKPLIKLIKAWNIANSHHLSSFHVELMVERMKRGHAVGEWPAEVAAVLRAMAGWLGYTFPDPWPSGTQVDSYLSSETRQKVILMMESDAKTAAQAEEYRRAGKNKDAFERWGVVYRHTFPAYG
jgi:hypothetical protein